MSLLFDHLVVKVNDLPAATKTFADAGFHVTAGGTHRGGLSENALIFFQDGTFIELLARKKGVRSFLLGLYGKTRGFVSLKYSRRWGLFHRFYDRLMTLPEGTTDFCLASADIEADLRRINAEGLFVTKPLSASRKKPDGSTVSWTMASTLLSELPFIRSPYSPAATPTSEQTTHTNGITGVKTVAVLALDFKEMVKNLAAMLDQQPAYTTAAEDKEATFSLGATGLVVRKSSEYDDLVRQFRSKGLGVFAVEWQFDANGAGEKRNLPILHGLVSV